MDENIIKYSDELRVIIGKSYESFEKQLNYISAGTLGLSMIFIENVVNDLSLTHSNFLIIISWISLGLTLISNLISHIYTSWVHGMTLSEIINNNYKFEKAEKRNNYIKYWNIVSIGLLILGIIFLISFVSTNI